jgi:calcineurin-like phosphoesterase family protein
LAIFLTSDLHLNHYNIITYCKRPFKDEKEMEDGIVKIFNEKVGPEDTVWHLGDFIFHSNYQEFMRVFERLPGNWGFVLGNHDRHTLEQWQQLKKHKRVMEITHLKRLKLQDKIAILCHYEMKTWEGKEWRRKRNYPYKVYHFYGHYHGTSEKYALDSAEVSIDATKMQLLTLEEHILRVGKEDPLDNFAATI